MRITIDAIKFKALLAVAPQNDIRYYLNGIHYDSKDNQLVATDGHSLLIIPCNVKRKINIENLTFHLPKVTPLKKIALITIDIGENSNKPEEVIWRYWAGNTFYVPQVTFFGSVLEGEYPEWRTVFTDTVERPAEKDQHEVTFNPDLIHRVTKHLKTSRFDMINIVLHGKNNAFEVKFGGPYSDIKYIVMPGRI